MVVAGTETWTGQCDDHLKLEQTYVIIARNNSAADEQEAREHDREEQMELHRLWLVRGDSGVLEDQIS